MATIDWAQLKEKAAAAGGFSNEPLPPGEYEVEVKGTNAGKTKDGKKERVGFRLQVLSGPLAGRSTWDNLTLSPESDTALSIFFRRLSSYGCDVARLGDVPLDQIVQGAVGSRGVATFKIRETKQGTFQNVDKFVRTGDAPERPASAAPSGDSSAPSGPVQRPF